jgi:hypothetical protein
MIGSIRFEHDKLADIHVAYITWLVETEDDCRVWHKQFEDYFKRFDKKLDIIYVCDNFRIGPKIGSIWGKYRADLNARYTRFSVRVHVEAKVALYTATSSAIHGVSFDEARNVETATAFIKEKRRRATVPA